MVDIESPAGYDYGNMEYSRAAPARVESGNLATATRVFSWFFITVLVSSLTGCPFVAGIARQKQNEGFEVKAGYPETIAVLAKVLQDHGYSTDTVALLKGADSRKARKVVGVKPLGVGGNNAMAGSTAIVRFEVSTKWDEGNWNGPAFGTLIVAPSGGMYDKSGRQFISCSKMDDHDLDVLVKEAQARLKGPEQESQSPAVAPHSDPADALYAEAASLYGAGNYDGSWQKAYAALQANPRHWQSWQMIGNCQYAKGDRAGALQSYNQSLAINPDNPSLRAFVQTLQP